jgi:hypothetical protein
VLDVDRLSKLPPRPSILDPGYWILDIRCSISATGTINWVDERVDQWLSPSIQMKRELKPEEHEEIVRAIAAGDRVKATSLYLSATEGDLTSAQNFIKTLIVEKQAAQSQQPAKRVADAE